MRAAVIDVGTNSIKLAIGERNAGGAVDLIAHANSNPRLGEGVDRTHNISPKAADRSVAAIAKMLRTVHQYAVDSIRLIGTSAMRDARNANEFVERVRRELGVVLEVLPEEDECRFSYLAVALDPVLGGYSGSQVVADVGGGSSELTFGSGQRIVGMKSVRVGAVRLTERHLLSNPPTSAELSAAREDASELISEGAAGLSAGRAVGVGGSAINLARVLKQIPIGTINGVHGALISRSDMGQLIDRLASKPLAERKQVVGLDPERADIVLGGALILEAVMDVAGASELVVSVHGLRYGILYGMLVGS